MIIIKKNSIFNSLTENNFKANNFQKIIEDKSFIIFKFGFFDQKNKEINKRILKNLKINRKFNFYTEIEGQYLLVIIDKRTSKIYFINSNTSFYSLFYQLNGETLKVSLNLSEFYSKKISLNYYSFFEWLLLGGRSLTNQTRFENVFSLLPGEILVFSIDGYNLTKKEYLYYKPVKNVNNLIYKIKKRLILNTNNLIKNNNRNILLGLSGGLDSRIIAGSIKKNNRKKIISYTYGYKYNFEKIISTLVTKICKLKQHFNLNISDKNYFCENKNYLHLSNLNSTFQHNYQINLFKKLIKKNKTNTFLLGCALDQYLGSSFSDASLKYISNKEEYFNWFKKKFYLFSDSELKKIFIFDFLKYKKKIKKNLFNLISKIKFKNFIDLNDSLHFEIRILRWYNKNLCFILQKKNRILAPTLEKKFLKLCFKVPYQYRLNDFSRKKLLKLLNINLADVQDIKDLLPASYSGNLNKVFSKKLLKLEELKSVKHINDHDLPSILYDVNFGKKFIVSKIFKNYLKKLLFELNKKKIFILINRKFYKKYLFSLFNKKLINVKKIIFLISLAELELFL